MTANDASSLQSARADIIEALNSNGKLGVAWPVAALSAEHAAELKSEVRHSGWHVKERHITVAGRWVPAWLIFASTAWQKIVLEYTELRRSDAIPTPGEASINARIRNAGLLADARRKLREALMELGGVEMWAEAQTNFPDLVRAELRDELRAAGWINSFGYARLEHGADSVPAIHMKPSPTCLNGANRDYVSIAFDRRLPTPAEATAAALKLNASTLRKVRRHVSAQLEAIRDSHGKIEVPSCPMVVRAWLRDRLIEAGWIVSDYPNGDYKGDKRWRVRAAVHLSRQESAQGTFFPVPIFKRGRPTAQGLALRARTAALASEAIASQVKEAGPVNGAFVPRSAAPSVIRADLLAALAGAEITCTVSPTGLVVSRN